jgi:hypothetical protein
VIGVVIVIAFNVGFVTGMLVLVGRLLAGNTRGERQP